MNGDEKVQENTGVSKQIEDTEDWWLESEDEWPGSDEEEEQDAISDGAVGDDAEDLDAVNHAIDNDTGGTNQTQISDHVNGTHINGVESNGNGIGEAHPDVNVSITPGEKSPKEISADVNGPRTNGKDVRSADHAVHEDTSGGDQAQTSVDNNATFTKNEEITGSKIGATRSGIDDPHPDGEEATEVGSKATDLDVDIEPTNSGRYPSEVSADVNATQTNGEEATGPGVESATHSLDVGVPGIEGEEAPTEAAGPAEQSGVH